MGPSGSVGAHIKTGRSPMAHDHFQTPPDPQKGYEHQNMIQTNLKTGRGPRCDNLNNFFGLFLIFWPSMAFLGVRGVLEMIVSHRAPSSLNMSSYRAIWIHFSISDQIP